MITLTHTLNFFLGVAPNRWLGVLRPLPTLQRLRHGRSLKRRTLLNKKIYIIQTITLSLQKLLVDLKFNSYF